jgi:hypothetical protein
VPADTALRVAEELCRIVDNQPLSTGVSCGVASTDGLAIPFDTPVRLFRMADAAQYRAKRSGSHTPVRAGFTAVDAPDEAVVDRRARRGRLSVDGQAVLESGCDLLDRLAGCETQTRLEAVADHLLVLLDAAAWWVSHVAGADEPLVSLGSSVARFSENIGARGIAQAELGASFDLEAYPASRAAVSDSRAFLVEQGVAGNDPAEQDYLVTAGYTSVLLAGSSGANGGWLVEIFGDPISMPFAGFEPVLRSLVAVAVGGGLPQAPTGPAVRRQLPSRRSAERDG